MATAVVIGSGVAGLATAEILVRNDWHVVLVERQGELGGEASRRTQNWLHTGWLYAGLPDPAAMEGCATGLELLADLYGIHGVTGDWFSARAMLYAYAVGTHELGYVEALGWRAYLSRVILPRMERLGLAGRDVEAGPVVESLLAMWEGGGSPRRRYRLVRTTDEGIETGRVLESLAGMLPGVEVLLGESPELVSHGQRTTVAVAGDRLSPDLVVVAAGSGIRELVAGMRPDVAAAFTSVASPIAVISPALALPSLIRYTPKLEWTINHLPYRTSVGMVSTVGAYDELPVPTGAWMVPDAFLEKVDRMMGGPKVAGVYVGTKTEYTRGAGRRYNHAVVRVAGDVLAAVPGKFSQFPLLVRDFAREVGLSIDQAPLSGGPSHLVGQTMPELIASTAEVLAA